MNSTNPTPDNFNNQPINNPARAMGMATLRIISRPYVHPFLRFFNPFLNLYRGYKIHIDIDNNSHVHKSKDKQMDIPVAPGEHFIRIGSISKKSAKAMGAVGKFATFAGAVTGSSATVMGGAALEDVGDLVGKVGSRYHFAPNEIVIVKVKQGFWGEIVIDE